jgi:AcrR family transcriptional regulator
MSAETLSTSSVPASSGAGHRRSRDDALAGRERLLDAAVELFSERGIANTTVAQIARAGEVTPAMVHYWFDTREKLYDAVVDERVAPRLAEVWTAAAGDSEQPVLNLVTGMGRQLVRIGTQSPWLPALWLREIIQVGGLLQERVFERIPQKSQLFCQRVQQAQALGEINPAIDPDLLLFSLLAMTMLPLAAAPGLKKTRRKITIDSKKLEAHVCALLEVGLVGTMPSACVFKRFTMRKK